MPGKQNPQFEAKLGSAAAAAVRAGSAGCRARKGWRMTAQDSDFKRKSVLVLRYEQRYLSTMS